VNHIVRGSQSHTFLTSTITSIDTIEFGAIHAAQITKPSPFHTFILSTVAGAAGVGPNRLQNVVNDANSSNYIRPWHILEEAVTALLGAGNRQNALAVENLVIILKEAEIYFAFYDQYIVAILNTSDNIFSF
jgi:hypothetical protein